LTTVSITYDGSATAPTNAGSYAVVASLSNANYTASPATGTLTNNKADATSTPSNLTQNYNGSPKSATATTSPAGVSGVSITYDGSAAAPTATGSVTIIGAAATITLSNLTQHYDGSPKPVTATPSRAGVGGVSITYAGSPAAPAGVGSYAVVASLSNANYTASNATGTLNIQGDATITLSNLTQTYDESSKPATVTTSPTPLTGVSITYNGSASAPTAAGSYAVVASLNNAIYTASPATVTLTIPHAPATSTLRNRTQ